jgi:hypothetical protein
MVEER